MEKRLTKDLAEVKHLLEARNKEQPAEERNTHEEIDDMARKVRG